MFNEWAALAFLNGIPGASALTPRLLAGAWPGEAMGLPLYPAFTESAQGAAT